jgi:hypothetical protein
LTLKTEAGLAEGNEKAFPGIMPERMAFPVKAPFYSFFVASVCFCKTDLGFQFFMTREKE